MQIMIQHLVNGLTIGMFYSLCALGYTLVYGVLKMINFAHGDLSMWGAYLGMTAVTAIIAWFGRGGPIFLIPAFIFSMFTVSVVGLLIERVVYRPVRKVSRLVPVVSGLGVLFVLESLARNIYGPGYQVFPQSVRFNVKWTILGGVNITLMQVIAMVVALVLMLALYWFIQKTKTGTAVRAVSLDHDTSRLMGIDVNRIISLTFFLGPMLGAGGAVLLVLYYGSFDFTLGFLFGMKAWTAAVLGGIGNIPGAMVGGLLLGFVEALGGGYISGQWKDVIAFGLLILVLMFRPTGLLGERVADKV
jgi:branched-chain amino acid transport system permease protein